MSKLGAVTAVAFTATIASAYADEQVWIVDNWPGDIDLIPCSAWTKAADGTWVLTGGAVKLGSEADEQYRGQGRRRGAHARPGMRRRKK